MLSSATHRSWAARVLLLVFVTMLLCAFLHRHQENFGAEVVCAECSQHVAGHSHLVAHGHGVEECVLCQFLTMVGTAVIAGFVIVLAATMGEVIYTTHPSLRTLSIGRHAPRAPPFM